jgi:hypothetical protein
VSVIDDDHVPLYWRIEPAELHRVYPPVQSNDADGNGTRHGATAEDRAGGHSRNL